MDADTIMLNIIWDFRDRMWIVQTLHQRLKSTTPKRLAIKYFSENEKHAVDSYASEVDQQLHAQGWTIAQKKKTDTFYKRTPSAKPGAPAVG